MTGSTEDKKERTMNDKTTGPYPGVSTVEGSWVSHYFDRDIHGNVGNPLPWDSRVKLDNNFATEVWKIMDGAGNLLLKKHEAYGPKNIAQAPGGAENGLRVRMWDKMARLNHILENPGVDVNDESIEDTLLDLLNYSAIFLLVRKGKWPAS